MDYQHFRYEVGRHCVTLLTCPIHQGLIPQGEHLTRRCSRWVARREVSVGWCPEAAMLPMEHIRVLVHIAVVLALALLMIKPQRWLRDGDPESTRQNPSLPLIVMTAGIGLWTGLIVLDSGTYLLMSLVLVGGLALQQASAVKAVLIGAATVVSLAVFIHSGQVAWGAALPLMLGSALGGWLGALLALGPNARVWIYRLLIAVLVLELGGMVLGWTVSKRWSLHTARC